MMTKYLTGSTKDVDQKTGKDKIALEYLKDFYFIFDFENLEISNKNFIKKVCRDRQLGKDKLESIFNNNKFPNLRNFSYNPPTSEELEIIEEYNKLDIDLFKASRALVKRHSECEW